MSDHIKLGIIALFVGLPGQPQSQLTLDEYGVIEDSKHYGLTTIVNARSRVGYPKPPIGSTEPNWRMFSAISLEDLAAIQANYNWRYQRHVGMIDPAWIGPNIVFAGMNGFSKLPDGTLFDFEGGPVLKVTSENKSCSTPGKLIANKLNLPLEFAKGFVQDADGYRGVVGVIEKGGILKIGMIADIILPLK